MSELHFPWLELAVLIPVAGAVWVARLCDSQAARKHAGVVAALALACAVGAWRDFAALATPEAHDRPDPAARLLGRPLLAIDSLNAPLLPLTALIYLTTILATLRTKAPRFSFARTLASEAIVLATLGCNAPWGVIALLALGAVPPYLELRARGRSTRVFVVHVAAFAALLVLGQALVEAEGARPVPSLAPAALLAAAVLVRSGIVPVHCWMTDLFEKAAFGTALLFVTPMIGAYAAVRLVLPVASEGVLSAIAWASAVTAVYAAGMALVQREARRFFCYLLLSHASLVLAGLETVAPVGLTGALCVWLSVGLALTGLGLTLRAMEARLGRVSLVEHRGMAEHTPMLAAFFLLTGLASVGFPGTFGFVGTELLVDGAVQSNPYLGAAVVVAAALNGVAVVQAYFKIFAGGRHASSISLRSRPVERLAVLSLTLLILGGGLWPQPGIASRYRAAMEVVQARRAAAPILDERPRNGGVPPPPQELP